MLQQLLDLLDLSAMLNSLVGYIPNVIAALAILAGGWLLVRLTRRPLRRVLKRADFSRGLRSLLVDSVYSVVVMAIAVVMAADQIGINVTAAIAGMGIAGVAAGFAAQDSLANSIAGFLIFWDKPFKVGDFVSVESEYGQVTEITLRTTRIRTRNNTFVVIPNKEIIDGVLVNHSMYGETRVDVPVGIAYKEDIDEARDALLAAVETIDGVLEDPAPRVVVKGLGASSIDLEVRVWICDAEVERPVYCRTVEACKKALDDAGIEIPFPHLQLFVDDVKPSVFRNASESLELEAMQ
jgi:small-conductance mechanosensitive channel